ncbi:hypothetical protein QYE76_038192 [Lolium multiflorum]|uniref:BTB domain-containing protein n=1 Tax=Lolium multiflorum TaxID=4521 RepID=A0AAD8WR10_LOLMU|nr:hypothetical protein QYE76_038192 [Lolium multiflorum]
MVGNREFRAHTSVLAARSPEFHDKLLCPEAEKDMPRVIEAVDDVEPAIFEMLLHYVYTESLPKCQDKGRYDVAVMQHLMVAAVKYKMDKLKLMCEEELCHKIDMDSIKTMFAMANEHNCKQLKAACDSFCDDFTQVLVYVGDSQIPSQVPDSQPAYESKVAFTPLHVSDVEAQVVAEVAARLATTKKNKNPGKRIWP